MMKRAMRGLVVIGAVMWAASSTRAAPVVVKSPGGKLEVEVAVEGGGKLTWTVRREGNVVLGPGALGLTVDGEELGTGGALAEGRRRTVGERDPTWGNHAGAGHHCMQGGGGGRRGGWGAVLPESVKGGEREGGKRAGWGGAMVAPDSIGLVNSDLGTNLGPPAPAELADAAWIKPGRVMWQWWAIGAPKLDDQKAWV